MRHFTPTDFHHSLSYKLDLHQMNMHQLLLRVFWPLWEEQQILPVAFRVDTWFHDGHSSVNVSYHRGLQNASHGEGSGYQDCDHYPVGTYHPSADHQMI